jgi:hypothetical protein
MNLIADTWRQLIRRRLWPLALLLVGALVAVPLTLVKSPEPLAAAPAPSKPAAEDSTSSLVRLAAPEDTPKRRRVLGNAKDPFEPAPLATRARRAKSKTVGATPTATPTATPASDSGGSSGGASPSSPAPSTPSATPQPTVPKYSIKVNFGAIDGDPVPTTLARLEPLPDGKSPVLVYEGVEDGGKVAVFMITGSVTAEGDGKCRPSPKDCATLRLRAGETEFITLTGTGDAETDGQYELDLVKIFAKRTAVDDATATASKTSAQRKLKGYRFNASTGTLHRVKSRRKRAAL